MSIRLGTACSRKEEYKVRNSLQQERRGQKEEYKGKKSI